MLGLIIISYQLSTKVFISLTLKGYLSISRNSRQGGNPFCLKTKGVQYTLLCVGWCAALSTHWLMLKLITGLLGNFRKLQNNLLIFVFYYSGYPFLLKFWTNILTSLQSKFWSYYLLLLLLLPIKFIWLEAENEEISFQKANLIFRVKIFGVVLTSQFGSVHLISPSNFTDKFIIHS